MSLRVAVQQRWDGTHLPAAEHAEVRLWLSPSTLWLHIDAPFHQDPPPPHPPGSTPELWKYEVVEVFILGTQQRYLEIELGPHGHHLLLSLHGVRQPVATALPCRVRTHVGTSRWTATASVSRTLLPPGPWHVNAYRIHGPSHARHYAVHTPLSTPQPDFHALSGFRTVLPTA